MKHFSIFCLTAILCGGAWADDAPATPPAPKPGRKQPPKTAAAPKPAKPAPTTTPAAAPAPAPVKDTEVPADAVKINGTTWQKADSQGHVWNYTKTPFGVTKTDAHPAAAKLPPPEAGFTAVEHGDSIEFGRDTPFGRQKWTKKKTELSDDERDIWLHQSGQKQAASKSQD